MSQGPFDDADALPDVTTDAELATTVASLVRADLSGADAGVQMLISSAFKNDMETLELLGAEIMPHFVTGP